jgi:predicted ATPase
MSKINIKLNETKNEYRSLAKTDFPIDLEGDLIIITGLNGSGKSQLFEAISDEDLTNILIDGVKLTSKEILYLKHSDLFPNEDVVITGLSKQNTYFEGEYKQFLKISREQGENFNIEDPSFGDPNNNYPIELFKIIAENSEKSIFELTREDFNLYFPIESRDYNPNVQSNNGGKPSLFNHRLGHLFKEYHNRELQNLILETLKTKGISDELFLTDEEFVEIHGESPWKKVNELFKIMKLDYKVNHPSITDEKIESFQVFITNETNDAVINFSSLSSGEKAIMSLVLAVFNLDNFGVFPPKILLLDEADASLHPSMIEQFLGIINDFFVFEEGMTVILATHNPITISFAPQNINNEKVTSYYEMNKIAPRLKKLSNIDEIEDSKKALGKFCWRYGTNSEKLQLIAKENTLPKLFVEGECDKIIITNAWNKLKPGIPRPFHIISSGGCSIIESIVENKDLFLESTTKIFTLCDYDNEGAKLQRNKFHCGKTGKNPSKYSDLTGYGLEIKKDNVDEVYLMLIPYIDFDGKCYGANDSKNNYFTIEHLFEKTKWGNFGSEKSGDPGNRFWYMPDNQKINFANSTISFTALDFENFKPIFETIEKILKT